MSRKDTGYACYRVTPNSFLSFHYEDLGCRTHDGVHGGVGPLLIVSDPSMHVAVSAPSRKFAFISATSPSFRTPDELRDRCSLVLLAIESFCQLHNAFYRALVQVNYCLVSARSAIL